MNRLPLIGLALLLVAPLSGCDQVSDLINKQKSNGKAVGAACRHSGRALEDCYLRNPKVAKADIFAGWKEMNEYMQAKKLDVVPARGGGADEEEAHAPSASKSASQPASAVKAASAASAAKGASASKTAGHN